MTLISLFESAYSQKFTARQQPKNLHLQCFPPKQSRTIEPSKIVHLHFNVAKLSQSLKGTWFPYARPSAPIFCPSSLHKPGKDNETGRETESTSGVALQASWEITLQPPLHFVTRVGSSLPRDLSSPSELYNYPDTADICVSNCLQRDYFFFISMFNSRLSVFHFLNYCPSRWCYQFQGKWRPGGCNGWMWWVNWPKVWYFWVHM